MSPTAAKQPVPPRSAPAKKSAGQKMLHVCPFCGSVNASAEAPCPRCTMANTTATRNATKSRIGPWYVLQSRNPWAPGMRHQMLLALVHKGQINKRTIIRGPTTHQLWRFAGRVKGVSREFGLCYACGKNIGQIDNVCRHCKRSQIPTGDPDGLLEGTMPAMAAAPAIAIVAPEPEIQEFVIPTPGAPPAPEVRAPEPEVEPEPELDEFVVPTPPPAPAKGKKSAPPKKTKAPPPVVEEEVVEEITIDSQPDAEAEVEDEHAAAGPNLSAPQLAAAFQLDFQPSKKKSGKSRLKSFALVLVALLILAGGGALMSYFIWPDAWQDVIAKLPKLERKSTKPVAAPTQNLPPTPPPAANVPPRPPVPDAPVIAPTSSSGTTSPDASEPPPEVQALWQAGIDAESRGDFSDAVLTYNRIRSKFPREMWPKGLDQRLRSASSKLK